MSKVYLVHSESGEYSDWSFVPLAVFTTREKAVEWIEGQSVGLYGWEWKDTLNVANNSWEEVCAYGHPTTTDNDTWAVAESEDGERVSDYNAPSWFIDEIELDPVREEHE